MSTEQQQRNLLQEESNEEQIKNFMYNNGGMNILNDEDGLNVMMMNNDFFNDDFYDYKDTFLNNTNKKKKKLTNNDSSTKNIVVSESIEDYLDENNDFQTGPLAPKRNNNSNKKFFVNDEDDDEEKEEEYEDFDAQNRNKLNKRNHSVVADGGSGNEDEEEEDDTNKFTGDMDEFDDQEDIMMMDTFFKRVDSLELTKPKKAKIISNYLFGELLGDGSYGKVKECLDMDSMCRRAVKIINLKMIARKIPRGVENVRKEIKIMRRLNHKNLIKLYGTFEKGSLTSNNNNNNNKPTPVQANVNVNNQDQDGLLAHTAAICNIEKPPKLYIFMDYCMTSMEKLLKNAPDQRLRNWQANYYFRQLIDGLEYLHSLNILHNDIKPGNLLITCDETLKICDFSISAELDLFLENYSNRRKNKKKQDYNKSENIQDDENNNEDEYDDYDSRNEINPNLLEANSTAKSTRFPIIQCTPMFQCPEMLDENIDESLILKEAVKIDVWSSGITLFQLTTGTLPFQGQIIHQIFENIRSNSYEIKLPAFIDKNLGCLLTNMLNRDPVKRWSLKQIRDSEWFKKKHPIVKEELAPLPQDVIKNELTTFRMISFLEKLCQPDCQNENVYANLGQENVRIINDLNGVGGLTSANSEYHTAELDANIQYGSNISFKESKYDNNFPNAKNQTVIQKNGPSIPIYSNNNKQATKVKRSHCTLM